jgi:PAT complex subunit CCDC47
VVRPLFLYYLLPTVVPRFDAHIPLFETQFSAPIAKSGAIVQDGAADFFNYSTGRRGLVSLHSTICLLPRHDALLRVFNFLWTMYDLTYTPRDEIQLDFTLQPSNPTVPFVWGIIKKDEMAEMRRTRWDLVCI